MPMIEQPLHTEAEQKKAQAEHKAYWEAQKPPEEKYNIPVKQQEPRQAPTQKK